MPRFYFHVRVKDGTIVPDFVGIEFADRAAAVADARQGIIEKPVAEFEAIPVSDETGQVVATVPFVQSRGKRPPLPFRSWKADS
jgi:hypothetical protein